MLLIVLVLHLDGSRPTRYGFKLDGEQPVSLLKSQLANLSSLSVEQLGFFDVTAASYLRRNILMDSELTKIKQLNNREFVAYELPISRPEDASPGNPPVDPNSPPHRLPNYLIAIHRRLERQERYLSPMTRHRIIFFGQPILIPYATNAAKKGTNEMIYLLIFKQLERLLRKNGDLNSVSNHAMDCDDSLGERYPFTLKHVNEDGKKCSICPWNR